MKKTKNKQGYQGMSIQQALECALQHHQAGNLQIAEQIYRQVIQFSPDNPQALHLLGVIAYQQKRYDSALALMGKALAAQPHFADAHSNMGNVLRDLGRLDEAAASYRRALACNSRFAMAHYNLGTVLASQGKADDAATCFRHALRINNRFPEAHLNLGLACRELGLPQEAEDHYRQALTLRPHWPQALFNLGNTLFDQNVLTEAAACYRQALDREPDYHEARLNLAATLHQLGCLDESAACYKQILTQQPNNADLLLNYGSLLREQGKPLEAETLYRQALAGDPSSAAAHFNLGNALRDQGRLQEAITSYRQALHLNPGCAAWYSNLGNALRDCGATEESLPIYEQALALDPDNVEALINLGNARKEGGEYGEAVAAYERARALRPDLAEIHFNLGTAFQDLCCLPEALACYRQALHLKPDHVIAHSNLLMNLQYDPAATPESILTESLQWAQLHTATIGTMSHDSATADPNRRLRIGYVSGDLRRHPIGYFLDGVLANHDRECWEIFCYANQSFGDDLTERLRGNTTSWREIFGETDETVAEMIRGDAIDILIDLAGHTARNRLLAFARKPAPVQATWAGYVGTTGLAAMDYLISDLQETPLGTESWYREALIRLPDCYVCYAPPEYAPPVTPLPAETTGKVTFGCFNNLAKLNGAVLALWTHLLTHLPDSRLLLVTKSLDKREVADRILEVMAPVADRVELSGVLPHRELLARYGSVDIALDPFPYSGGLTTLEALWMGVPVITLGGERFASRHSVSHLTAAGLSQLITHSEEEYIATARALAGDLAGLAELRRGLRDRVRTSPLCNYPRFTKNLEAAYRTMWHNWCAGRH